MSELYVSTSMGEYVIAAVMGTRRSFYHTEKGAANLDGFFECFAKLKEEFPLPSLRKIFVEIGPGSFTGVRVGVTFARMLSQQLRIPLVPMKALDIVAAGDFASGGETARTGALMVAPLLDTGNGFVYGAVFRPGESCGDIYAVEISEWLDYVQSLGGKICLCGRVSPRDEEILKNRELPFRKLETADIIENMITLSARGPLETPSRSGAPEPRSSAPYGEVTPVYINRKEAEEKWQEKLEDEMVKIAELVEKKEGVINEIKNLEKLKHEKEKDIEDIGLLSEKTDSARRELASSMDELSILSAKRTAYTESISAKEKKIAEYEKKLEELKSRSRDCERELALREAKYEKIKELPPEIPREVELYIQQRDELKAEVEDLKKEKSSCSGELDDIATSRFEEVFERIKTEEAMMEDLSVKRRQKEEQIKSLEERLREIARKSALAENELEERIVSAGKFDGRAASVEEEKPDSRETSPEEPAPPEEPEQEEIYASSASPSDEALPSASDVQPATADVQHPSGRDTAEKEAENAETLSAAAAILPLRDKAAGTQQQQ
ncbi:tRNA (adenosine(37)-N6)-threonylcarbamoyltransferase complex dimerization subunit type 1 TsaB, partial [bacterium]|nr:tRNA (adenosine(37)-N6)-threonylcarbamoyltransferase complex dimerization subunit type 1 TsaB [bacterium]